MSRELKIDLDYIWLPAQQQFHESTRKFRAYIGGIGAGKTYAGCMEALWYQALPKAGTLGVIIAPTFPMLRDATMRTFFSICPPEIISNWNKTTYTLKLVNGSEILFRSADKPDRLRGPTITWFWMDEAADCKPETWDIMMGRLRQPKYSRCGFLTGTPKGFNWIYDKFVLSESPEYEIVHAKTRDNAHLPEDYLESLEGSYSGTFALQELEGQFVVFEGLVYPGFDRFENIISAESIKKDEFKTVVGGVDFGWTNPTVMLVIGQRADGALWVLDEIYRSRMTPEDMVASAKILQARWNVSRFFCDPSSPDLIDAMTRKGIPAIKANNAKMPGIAAVNATVSAMKISAECKKTIWEMERYRYPESQSGKEVKEEPLKIDDHAMDALRYSVMGVQRSPGRPMPRFSAGFGVSGGMRV